MAGAIVSRYLPTRDRHSVWPWRGIEYQVGRCIGLSLSCCEEACLVFGQQVTRSSQVESIEDRASSPKPLVRSRLVGDYYDNVWYELLMEKPKYLSRDQNWI